MNHCCLQYERSHKPPRVSSHSKYCTHKLCGVLDVIMENWEEGSSNSKNEIQYLLDLRTKLNPLIHVTLI